MFDRLRLGVPILEREASLSQRARIYAAAFGFGHIFTRLAVEAEIFDRLAPESADPDVSPADLLAMYDAVTNAEDFREQYRLLSQPLPNKENKSGAEQRVWFDAIDGLTDVPILRAVTDCAELFSRMFNPTGKAQWEHAADLGAGTGMLGRMLVEPMANREPIAARLTMVDAVPEILDVAKSRGGTGVDYHCGNVLDLDFDDANFDLMVSGGLAYLLGNELQKPFFREMNRLLKPGGVYIDGDQNVSKWTTLNPGRFHLQRLILSHLAGTEMLGDPLSHREDFPFTQYSYEEKSEFFSDLGFTMWQRVVRSDSAAPIIVRILVKNFAPVPET